jgi:hypothetical protein
MCAASDKSAIKHINGKIGNSNIIPNIRNKIIKETAIKFKYRPLISLNKKYVKNISRKFIFGNLENPLFNLSDFLWKDALYWV